MMPVIWSPKAIANLEYLVEFLDEKWNRTISDDLLEEIDKTIQRVSDNPHFYPLYSKKKEYP